MKLCKKKMSKRNYVRRVRCAEERAQEVYASLVSFLNGNETAYEDIIVCLIGANNLRLLKETGYVETCDIYQGRVLYAI